MPQIDLHIARDHPAYRGHFPEQPILPGVVLLDAAQRVIETECDLVLNGLSVAKFHSPALPGDALTLDYIVSGASIAFDITCNARKIASGKFIIAAAISTPIISTPVVNPDA